MKPTPRLGLNLLALFTIYLALTTMCLAGGSIGWDQVRAEIAKDDPFLANYIAKNFEMRYSGGAVRVGHDKDGNSLVPGMGVGARMPPYEFPAKPLGASGDFTLFITLNPDSFDNGKTILWVLTLRKRLPSD